MDENTRLVDISSAISRMGRRINFLGAHRSLTRRRSVANRKYGGVFFLATTCGLLNGDVDFSIFPCFSHSETCHSIFFHSSAGRRRGGMLTMSFSCPGLNSILDSGKLGEGEVLGIVTILYSVSSNRLMISLPSSREKSFLSGTVSNASAISRKFLSGSNFLNTSGVGTEPSKSVDDI